MYGNFVFLRLVVWLYPDSETKSALAHLGAAALFNGFADHLGAILRGQDRFSDETRLNATRGVLVLAFGAIALTHARSLVAICVALAAASFGALGYGIVALLGLTSRGERAWFDRRQRALAKRALAESVPIWLAGLLSLLYFKADTFFVRAFAGEGELGAYGVAYKVFEGAMIVPAIVLAVTFPRLARAFAEPVRQARLERRVGTSLLGLGGVVGAFCFLARTPLIVAVFGATFLRAVDSLKVLSLGLPLVYLNFGLTHFLIARHRERVNTILALMMLALVLALDSLLIPRGSGPGAALATVLAEGALTLACLLALRRPTTKGPGSSRTE